MRQMLCVVALACAMPLAAIAKPQDDSRAAAERAYAEGEQLHKQGTAESLPKAIEKYQEALPLFRAAGDRRGEIKTLAGMAEVYYLLGEAQKSLDYFDQALRLCRLIGDRREEASALSNIGAIYDDLGETQKALDYYNQALPLQQTLGDSRGEAATLNNLGYLYHALGELQKALDYYLRVPPLSRALGDRQGEATALSNIALVYDSLGEAQKALDHYGQALHLHRAASDRRGEASTLSNIGATYHSLGETPKALEYYNQALPLRQSAGDRRGEASTLNNLGAIYDDLGDMQKALAHYEQALAIRRAVKDSRGEARTLNNIGWLHWFLGDQQKALDYYNNSLALKRAAGDRQGEAVTLHNIGWVYSSLNDKPKALAYFNQALRLRRALGDRSGEAATLAAIARAERDRGKLIEARAHIEAALAIIESLRVKVASQDLRAAYLASKQSDYEFYIDLLMRLHQRQPSAGYDAEALRASERARARSLLETLSEARADIRQGVAPTLLERERGLQQQIEARERNLARVLSRQHTPQQEAAAKKEIETLVAEYQNFQAEIRATSPRYAALKQPAPLGLKEIQQHILDEDSLLLEYALGAERSFLWAVTRDSLTSYILPGRAAIETAARHAYDLLTGSHLTENEVQTELAVADLSRMVLGPVAARLEKKRLLIVADGALQYIPFAALPIPAAGRKTTSSSPLIVRHEVVVLPSASTVAALRRDLTGRESASKVIAVLADPVFDSKDERVQPIAARAEGTREVAPQDAQRLLLQVSDNAVRQRVSRLPYTRKEAERLAALVPTDKAMQALDFAASRNTVMAGGLDRFRFVHFATHGFINSQRPALSGIVLSLVDEKGNPQNGFLRLHDIYNLKLRAELVVLSACQTALGKEIKGEGLVGLTRGFMYAGAPRVMASLWSVGDEATAELMTRFYTAMLKEGQRPAAALRSAQVSMWKEKRWAAPYYWAAFTLQGEWK